MQVAPGQDAFDAAGAITFGPLVTPRFTPVASRTEAAVATLVAARAAAHASADLEAQIRASLALLVRYQFRPGPAHLFADPDAARGAIPGSPVDWQLRIDYAQHAGSAMLRWLRASEPWVTPASATPRRFDACGWHAVPRDRAFSCKKKLVDKTIARYLLCRDSEWPPTGLSGAQRVRVSARQSARSSARLRRELMLSARLTTKAPCLRMCANCTPARDAGTRADLAVLTRTRGRTCRSPWRTLVRVQVTELKEQGRGAG